MCEALAHFTQYKLQSKPQGLASYKELVPEPTKEQVE